MLVGVPDPTAAVFPAYGMAFAKIPEGRLRFASLVVIGLAAILGRVDQELRAGGPPATLAGAPWRFMTPTVLHQRPAVRAAFSNWSTTDADVDHILQAIAECIGGTKETAP